MRPGVSVLLSLVLLSAPAWAQEAAKPQPASNPAAESATPAGPVQVEVLVLGGGKTPEDAQAWLQRWKAAAPLLESVVGLAEGFPQVVQSDKVPGLKPGFHIVILGFCPATHRETPHSLIKHFFPGTYARPVLIHDEGCPAPVDEATVSVSYSVKKDDLRMTAVQVDSKESSGAYVGLFRGDTLLDHKLESYSTTGGEERGAESCGVTLSRTKSRLMSETSCSVVAFDCNNDVSAYSHRTSYSIDGEKIASAKSHEKETRTGYCD